MNKKHIPFFLLLIFTIMIGGYGFSGSYAPGPARPEIKIHRAYPVRFPVPYGFGLRIEYTYDLHLDEAPYRKAVSITTQYSPDGKTWYTDEAARSINYNWDNIHGDIFCGPAKYNLQSGHTYYVRVILNYTSYNEPRQKQSIAVQATVEDYSELIVEEEIAKKFAPVFHRHLDDLQPPYLVNVDNVNWTSRKAYNVYGREVPSNQSSITKYSDFHWRYSWQWDTWGVGQTFVQYKWDMVNSERYKTEIPGERPLYFHVYLQGGYYYVQYWYFLTMNDIRDQMSKYDPWHEGDFEHVSIEVEKIGEDYVPRRVNFYSHVGGHQYSANDSWWGTDQMVDIPQKGYDGDHTHLHVWLARNSHGSYNYGQNIYRLVTVNGAKFQDDVDFTLGYSGVAPYAAYFHYDYLANMGEIKSSPDSDNDGYINAHGFEWYDHDEPVPAWYDFQWLPFRGPLGDYWCKSLGLTHTCTPAPNSPPFGLDWMKFSNNKNSCGGFGNEGKYFFGIGIAEIQFLDSETGEVLCTQRP